MRRSSEPTPEGQVRSLQSFLNRSVPPDIDHDALDGEAELQPFDAESELKCSSAVFFDADSDLATIFSPGSKRREAESNKYEEQIHSLEFDIVTLMDEVTALNGYKSDAEKAHTLLQEDNEKLKHDAKDLRTEIRDLKENIQRLEQAKSMLLNVRTENEALKEDLQKLSASKDALESTNADLKLRISDLSTASSDINALRPEVARVQRELDAALAEVKDWKENNSRLEGELEKQRAKFDSSVREHSADRNRLEDQIKALQVKDDDTERALNRAKDELSKSLQRISQLESEILYVRRQHDDELDRLDRELRRAHSDMSDVVLENRRLKAQSMGSYTEPSPRVQSEELYHPPPPRNRDVRYDPYRTSSEQHIPPAPPARYTHDEAIRQADDSYESRHSAAIATVQDRYPRDQNRSLPTQTTAPDSEFEQNRAINMSSTSNSRAGSARSAPLSSMITSSSGGGKSTDSTQPIVSQSGAPPKTLRDIVSNKNALASKSAASPFATDYSMAEDMQAFDAMERELTSLMTEKTQLDEELSRLHQRGGKVLKERVREQQVEARLIVLSKEISKLRKSLLNVMHQVQ